MPVNAIDSVTRMGGTFGVNPPASASAVDGGFGKIVDQLLGTAGTQRVQANQAVQDLIMGKTEDVHNVALAVSNADLTFRLILEIRNRLTEAYQEITRMQI